MAMATTSNSIEDQFDAIDAAASRLPLHRVMLSANPLINQRRAPSCHEIQMEFAVAVSLGQHNHARNPAHP